MSDKYEDLPQETRDLIRRQIEEQAKRSQFIEPPEASIAFYGLTESINIKIQERVQDFIITEIIPYAQTVTKKSITKHDIKEALTRYMRKGRWIVSAVDVYNNGSILEKWYKCPECGYETALDIPRNYCPECGARMGVK